MEPPMPLVVTRSTKRTIVDNCSVFFIHFQNNPSSGWA